MWPYRMVSGGVLDRAWLPFKLWPQDDWNHFPDYVSHIRDGRSISACIPHYQEPEYAVSGRCLHIFYLYCRIPFRFSVASVPYVPVGLQWKPFCHTRIDSAGLCACVVCHWIIDGADCAWQHICDKTALNYITFYNQTHRLFSTQYNLSNSIAAYAIYLQLFHNNHPCQSNLLRWHTIKAYISFAQSPYSLISPSSPRFLYIFHWAGRDDEGSQAILYTIFSLNYFR